MTVGKAAASSSALERDARLVSSSPQHVSPAEIALGDVDRGLARLEAAQIAAGDAHPAIRSEIALRRSRGYYVLRDLARSEESLSAVSAESDIIYARALNYRGWIETARGDHAGAALSFVGSVQQLDQCRHRDRLLETNNLFALSFLAAEQFDGALWDFIEARSGRLDWSADGLPLSRWWITMAAALVHEARGETLLAFSTAREAEQLAPSAAYRVAALCRRAELARNAGETFSPADHLAQARALFDTISSETLHGDERYVPLDLAGECALAGDAGTGRRYYEVYRSLAPMDAQFAMSADPRMDAHERLVEAAIADASGETSKAHRLYADAFRRLQELGYRRRAVACALRLGELTGHDRYYQYVTDETRSLSGDYWVRRAMARRERFFMDPVARRLTAAQREVLDLICQGRTNAEIARDRDRAVTTVKHTVTGLFDAFRVRNRAELIITAQRRFESRPSE